VHAESVAGLPEARLRDAGGLAYHGYDLRGGAPGEHRGLPSPFLTLVVTFGEPLSLRGPDGAPVRARAVLGGLHDAPATIVHDGRQSGIHVLLDPLAARALVGTPAGELAGRAVGADAVLGVDAAELADRVEDAAGWEGRFAALDAVLLRRLARARRSRVHDEIGHAWRRILATGGATPVESLAREVGWSARHLGQRFRAELGVGPKVAARMARFDRVRRRIAARALAGRSVGLAEVAADGGYADQQHLAREFRALAGCSATRWVAEEIGDGVTGRIGNVHDPVPDHEEASAS